MCPDANEAWFVCPAYAGREIGEVVVLVQLTGFVSAVEIRQEPILSIGQDVGLHRGRFLGGIYQADIELGAFFGDAGPDPSVVLLIASR